MCKAVFHQAVTIGHLADAVREGMSEVAGNLDHNGIMKIATALYERDPKGLGDALYPLLQKQVSDYLEPVCAQYDNDPDLIERTNAERKHEIARDAWIVSEGV